MPENAPAIALYRRHGFEVVDEPGDPLPYGTGTELLMRKTLDTSPV